MPSRLLYFMILATFLALAVVWENAALRRAGYRLEQLRAQVAEQRAEKVAYQAHLSKLRNPQRVLGLVKYLGLDLSERSLVQPEAEGDADGKDDGDSRGGPAAAPVRASRESDPSAPADRPQPDRSPAARPRPARAAASLASAQTPSDEH